ncbi:MAG: serine hydrolase, partial [Gammaproteobacteria bacterium]|nr:serine hydrolase [Gammaproteobacteria bacterium]
MNHIFHIYTQIARMSRIVLYTGIFISAIVISTNTLAADLPLEKTITSALTALFANSGAPGMVIAVVRGDILLIQGYGETQKGNHQQPDANSLLRVGSISKVLATDLMVKLAEEGKLKLSDPLQKYAPLRFKMPHSEDDAPITLLNLATHTSGLPRSVNATPPDQAPPFTWPDKSTRWDWLSQQTLVLP